MNDDANRTTVRRSIKDVMEKNRPELLDERCADEFVLHFRGETHSARNTHRESGSVRRLPGRCITPARTYSSASRRVG